MLCATVPLRKRKYAEAITQEKRIKREGEGRGGKGKEGQVRVTKVGVG